LIYLTVPTVCHLLINRVFAYPKRTGSHDVSRALSRVGTRDTLGACPHCGSCGLWSCEFVARAPCFSGSRVGRVTRVTCVICVFRLRICDSSFLHDVADCVHDTEPHKVGPRAATWQVELQQYNLELWHKAGEDIKADTLSCCPDFDTGNPNNDHLIVLPLDQFKGMPESMQALSQSNSTSEITLSVTNLDQEQTLDEKVKQAQDTHYNTLKPLITQYNLDIDSDNYLWKGASLVIVENNDLRRGVLQQFHTSKTAGHLGIMKTIQLIQAHY